MAVGVANEVWYDSEETSVIGLEEVETPEQTASWKMSVAVGFSQH